LLIVGGLAGAYRDADATPEITWPSDLYNPQPLADDVILPLSCGGAMVFRKVATPPPQDPYPVAGPFMEGNDQSNLLMGKYEITRFQAQTLQAWAEGQPCPVPDARANYPHPLTWSQAIDLAHHYSLWLTRHAEHYPDCTQGAAPCLPRVDGLPAFVRLPLEAEWEYAARGGLTVDSAAFTAPRYPTAGGIDAHAWYRDNTEGNLQSVGTRAASPLGLHDLYGNVAELMLEPYRPDHTQPSGGAVIRGGSVASSEDTLTAGHREQVPPIALAASSPIGARLVAAVPLYTSVAKRREAAKKGPSGANRPGEIPPPPAPVRFVGHLRVKVNIAADIRLDGRSMGRATPDTPLEIEDLNVGEHRIEVVASPENTVTQTLRIATNRWTEAEIALQPLMGHLRVRVNVPAGVSLDDRPVGRAIPDTPLEIEDLNVGEHRIVVTADGYQPVTQTPRITTNEWTEASIMLVSATPTPLNPEFPFEPEMIALPGGTFWMGSPADEPERDHDEGPRHEVTVPPFAIGKYEVTFEEYDRFAKATGQELPDDEGWGRGRHPVINVSWHDAVAYVAWLSKQTGKSYRLPTEAEWEYAARAGTTTPFWTGPCIHTDQANYYGKWMDYNGCGANIGVSRWHTVEVGNLPANPWGLHEVHGNVWEWVQDRWHDDYRGAPVDGRAWETGDDSRRVLRGGSWGNGPRDVRSADRGGGDADNRSGDAGFRPARTLNP
jgi:formylglycine-generating enzyme required for sulfatase activity